MKDLRIITEKVVFYSPVRNNKMVYMFETRLVGNLTQVFSSFEITEQNSIANNVKLTNRDNVDEAITDIINLNQYYKMEIESREVINDFKLENKIVNANIVWEGKLDGFNQIEIKDTSMFEKGKQYSISMKTYNINQNVNVEMNKHKIIQSNGDSIWRNGNVWMDVLGTLSTRDTKLYITNYFIKNDTDDIIFSQDTIGMVESLDIAEHVYGEITSGNTFKIRSNDENSTDEIIIKEL